MVTSYEVSWVRDTSGACPNEDRGTTTLTGTDYVIGNLEENSVYLITVRAHNGVLSSTARATIANTQTAGKALVCVVGWIHLEVCLTSPSFSPSLFQSSRSDVLVCDSPVGACRVHPPQWRHHWLSDRV